MAGECQGRRSPPAGAGRPASKLSLLVGLAESFSSSPTTPEGYSRSPTARSPRSFDYEGAVGLGIVAAMNDGKQDSATGAAAVARTPRSVAPRRSEPIPIASVRPEAPGVRRKERWVKEEDDEEEEEEMMMLSESYTCVISHVAGAAVSKRVYLDDDTGDFWGCCPGVFFESPPPPRTALLPRAEDFLSRCFRCSKNLHGLDIFMYRGDKAFCSAECRCQQIISDEHREKCIPPDSLKKNFDCSSVSPCSAPLIFAAGLAAA